jgi:pimeloyl-ACP methyl ester carboxylesterase
MGSKRSVLDGPFTESKELLFWPVAERHVGEYASVNGLRMYYEVHGRGRPLVLLHGALEHIERSFGQIVRALAASRKVIAIEQQAHGRTEDIARPLTYEQMADDTAELLRKLEIDRADVFGFSMGGGVALVLAVRHPDRVRKVAVVSGSASIEGFDQDVMRMLTGMGPDDPAWLPLIKDGFMRVAATPGQWPAAVRRIQQAFLSFRGLRREQLQSIRAQTLFVGGESGVVKPGHLQEIARFVPRSRLEIFAGDDHDPTIIPRSAQLIPGFLDA